ncbi:homoserine kinase [Leptospira semungkisensis]|uniref:Homoserine kinase n=1 Tax=Leptospira semungkisensis TaxID=2484985 RepID=A0A4R9FKT5_9LEPT|nr:homoserine kinase [Leptospira semungkisensis]TGJ99251.1 homoserine kinase [Leptospira semungkisensis]
MSGPKYKFQIKVPGTSANLGSGFDLLGMAFQIYNEFVFEFGKTSQFQRRIKGRDDSPFSDEEDLVLQSYKEYFSTFISNQLSAPAEPTPYSVVMDLDLPLKGGLGSSASAVVAGFCAARFAQEKYFPQTKLPSESEFLYRLALLEGHPDNTTPAYLGGFVFSYFAEERLYYFKRKFPKNIHCFFLIPELEIATNHSRKCLPETYSTADVIYNMSRMATWWEFLDSGKPGLLERALEDKIHTPYRMNEEFPLLPLVKEIQNLSIGVSLSGSGPTVVAYARRKDSKRLEKKLLELTEKFSKEKGIVCRLVSLGTDTIGARISSRKIS